MRYRQCGLGCYRRRATVRARFKSRQPFIEPLRGIETQAQVYWRRAWPRTVCWRRTGYGQGVEDTGHGCSKVHC